MKKNFKSTLTACLSALAILTNVCSGMPLHVSSISDNEQAFNDLEVQKELNNEKIQALQDEIAKAKEQFAAIEADETAKLEYKNALNEKIELQNQNIDYVAEQISMIDDKINDNITQIAELDKKIAQNEKDIEENTELLKQRVRASYMSGEDNITAILAGSTSFFDILAKFKLVAKITEHDSDLIDTLDNQLKELAALKESLYEQREVLNSNLDAETLKKEEFSAALEQMAADYTETQNELIRLGDDKAVIVEDIEAREAAMAEQEEELKKIAEDMAELEELIRQEAISESIRISESIAVSVSVSVSESKAAEESRIAEESRRAEEERKAEESRKAEEEKKKQQQAAAPSLPSVEQTPVTQPPATEPPAPVTPPPVQTAPPQISSSGFMWPVPGYGRIGSGYGPRSLDNHKGIDINASDGGTILGHEIVAAASGYIATAENSCTHNYGKSYSCGCGGGYGRYVVIRHDDGSYATLYGHMSSVAVSRGQHVSQGQLIGYAGTTGYSFGPHLHFEVHRLPFSYERSNTLDPEDFVTAPY